MGVNPSAICFGLWRGVNLLVFQRFKCSDDGSFSAIQFLKHYLIAIHFDDHQLAFPVALFSPSPFRTSFRSSILLQAKVVLQLGQSVGIRIDNEQLAGFAIQMKLSMPHYIHSQAFTSALLTPP